MRLETIGLLEDERLQVLNRTPRSVRNTSIAWG
jgi:hypothetical protein